MAITTLPPSRDLTRITLTIIGICALISGSLWVLRPFIGALLWAVMVVVSTWPFMLRLQALLGGRRGAAVTVLTVTLLLVLFVPLYVALSAILEQSDRVTELLRQLPNLHLPAPPDWFASVPLFGEKATRRWLAISALPPNELADLLAPHLRTGLGWFAAQAGSFGGMVVQFLLTVIISAILYAKGEAGAQLLRRFFRRLSGERGEKIVTLSGQAIRAVAMGIVVTAVVQTVLAGAGLFIARMPLAGFITAVVLVFCIAQVGPLLALLPCVIWLYVSGAAGRGTVLLVFMVVAQVIDNVLRPVLIRRGADISLLLILPGVIGGLLGFGILGLFIGPVILAVTSTLLEGWMGTPGEDTAEAAEPPAVPTAPPGGIAGAGAG